LLVENVLSIIGFFKGYSYDVEIIKVINRDFNIDFVFGIDIPYIENRNKTKVVLKEFNEIWPLCSGTEGTYLRRCFTDLTMSIKQPDDTGFYCFRAIESLRQLVGALISIEKEKDQWIKFSEVVGFDKDYIQIIRSFAFPARHGLPRMVTENDRIDIFERSWSIVENYLSWLKENHT
jgi:hypothetical protein